MMGRIKVYENLRKVLCGGDKEKADYFCRMTNEAHEMNRDNELEENICHSAELLKEGKGVQIGWKMNRSKGNQPIAVSNKNLLSGHGYILGSSGCGKTYLILNLIRQLIKTKKEKLSCIIFDQKGDLAEHIKSLWLPYLLSSMENSTQKKMLDNLVIINPFSTKYLPPFQILKKIPNVHPELQARTTAILFEKLMDSPLGIRQSYILEKALLLAIQHELPLPKVRDFFINSSYLTDILKKTKDKDLRNWFHFHLPKENRESKNSLLSRLDYLLMLPQTKWMLSAPNCIQFPELLESGITIVNLGGPPLGAERISVFWGTFIFEMLTRAIFNRDVQRNTPPVIVFIDEFQELLSSELTNQMERILALSRSKKVFLWLIHQQIAQIRKTSPALLKIILTNTAFQCIFRSNYEDAKSFSYLLPVTGKRLRSNVHPMEQIDKKHYCTPAEELRLLTKELTTLPNRAFYFLSSREMKKAQLLYSPTLSDKKAHVFIEHAPKDYLHIFEKGSMSLPVESLKDNFEKQKKDFYFANDKNKLNQSPKKQKLGKKEDKKVQPLNLG